MPGYAKRHAPTPAVEMVKLIAERDALETKFMDNPSFIRQTVDVLNEKIGHLRQLSIKVLDAEEPVLDDLPPRREAEALVTISEKRFFPKKEFPDINFAGRVLGPRGTTIRSLEKRIPSSKLSIRGKGSLVETKQKPGELVEEQHLLIMICDTLERAPKIMEYALKVVEPFFHPMDQRLELLKDTQMREMALIQHKENGVPIHFMEPPSMRTPQFSMVNAGAYSSHHNLVGVGMGMLSPASTLNGGFIFPITVPGYFPAAHQIQRSFGHNMGFRL